MTIPIAKPVLGPEELRALEAPLASGWVTQGPEVAQFEREFAAFVGAREACAVANCTAALHLGLLAAGVQPGDEVVTVSHSFIATANAIRYCSATPVFVDIDPATFNIDPAAIEPALSERTRCILVVHQMGMPCDLRAVLEIAARHSLPVLEDAACAAGSEVAWDGGFQKIGRPHGILACFSFHPRKVITTGDGGMITTDDPEIARRVRLLRQHAMDVPDTVRHGAARVTFESFSMLGYNYRLTDLQAAIGRVQLRRLPALVAQRRRLAERYRRGLADVPGLVLPAEPAWARTNWQSYCVRLPDGCDQRQVMQDCLDRGIATRRGIMNSHQEPAYAAPGSHRAGPSGLARSERARDRCILLPLYDQLTDAEQDEVMAAVRDACARRA